MPEKRDQTVKILVSGDVVVDNHIYAGERKAPDDMGRGTIMVHEWGGAKIAEGILKEFANHREPPFPVISVSFGLKLPQRPCLYSKEQGCSGPDTSSNLHCYAKWEPVALPSESDKKIWRVTEALGYGGKGGEFHDFAPIRNDPPDIPDILVLDDGALGFRFKLDGNPKTGVEYVSNRGVNKHFAWPEFLEEKSGKLPRWIVLKMARPLCKGDLWTTLTLPANKKRLVVVVSINDIRRCPVQISRGFSWERTATDLIRELMHNPILLPLLECKHLIIPLHSEGALWVENASSQQRVFHLILDPGNQEGEWLDSKQPGRLLGYLSCMTASLAAHLACDSNSQNNEGMLERGICLGLGAMRTLFKSGHGFVGITPPGFPFEEIASKIALGAEKDFSCITIQPQVAMSAGDSEQFNILADSEFRKIQMNWPLLGVARRVAMFGTVQLQGAPHAKYGNFLTADRGEIEDMQNLRKMIRRYANNQEQKTPLNIAVFGPPGAGKSFAVKQLAKGIISGDNASFTFNLSQFDSQENLIDAFHQVRDAVLRGNIPLVFWDEFDTDDLKWLKSFLAPMQDGEFTQGQCTHYIGRSIFVFAGGTRESMEEFLNLTNSDSAEKSQNKEFIVKKGPDFVSRLSGYLNVRGPNPQPLVRGSLGIKAEDICYPVRRATMLRSMMRLKENDLLRIDRDVLTAVLATTRYKNGSRSLEKLLLYLSAAAKGDIIRPSHLPPRDVLSMLVEDVDDFFRLLRMSASFSVRAADLAPKIHEAYRKNERKEKRIPKWDLPFDKLPEYIKQDNIVAAERILELLAMVGLTAVPSNSTNRKKKVPDTIISDLLTRHADILAQQEHDGWEVQKRYTGYQYNQVRDESKRLHNAMLSYKSLTDEDKSRDIYSVLSIPERVREARHVIVSLSQL